MSVDSAGLHNLSYTIIDVSTVCVQGEATMRVAKMIAMATVMASFASYVHAAKLDDQFRILAEIRTTAVFLCPDVPLTSRSDSTRQESWSEVSTNRLNTLKSKGTAKTLVERRATEGVLQEQLADLLKNNRACRLQVLRLLQRALLPGPDPRIKPNVTIRVAAAQASSSPPKTITKNGPTLRVFLKNNLTNRDIAALAELLPRYNVMLGKSSIEPSVGADTIFVNRDQVTIPEVVAVLRAMQKIGVPIKTVMQTPVGGRRELQVGTVAAIGATYTDQSPLFHDASYLDVEELSRRTGADFWRAATNGYELCLADGGMVSCRLDENARPTLR